MVSMEESQKARSAIAISIMMLGCVAVTIFVVGTETGVGPSELATDCSVDPWAHSCHPASMMDMINNVGHRARSNAIAQHKLKMQLLAEQKLMLKHEETKEENHNEKVIAKEDASGKGLAKTVYKGVDITSKASVDSEIKKLMKNGGRGAVEKKVDELREEILADASKLTTYGKKAGYLPPPPGMSKKAVRNSKAEAKRMAKKAEEIVDVDPKSKFVASAHP